MKVQIDKIEVSGFKNVSDQILNLDNLIALISLNNYGKSNILESINFGISFIKVNEEHKNKMMHWYDGISINKYMASKNFSFAIYLKFKNDNDDVISIVKYSYSFEWTNKNNTGAKIIQEDLKIKEVKKNQKFSSFIKRTNSLALYKSSQTSRCDKKILIADDELVINKLKAYDDIYYIDIIKAINFLNVYIERHLDVNTSYTDFLLSNKKLSAIDLNNDMNIPKVLYYLKNEYEEKYKLLIDSFKLLFPNITYMDVRVIPLKKLNGKENSVPFILPENVYVLEVQDQNLNQKINFVNMSDGTKRILLHLTSIVLADIQGYSLIAIEEPENSIHPMLFQSYLRVIEKFKGNCKIIITSHSPYLVQYVNIQNIYIGIPGNDGIARFFNISNKNAKKILSEALKLNVSIGEYIFDLLSGSQDDIKELKSYYSEEN